VNRPLVLGIIGGLIVAVALALTFLVDEGDRTDAVAVLKNQPSKTAGAPVSDGPRDVVARVDGDAPGATREPAGPDAGPVRPSFDVVRVNPRGDAVIAGHAAPNAEVVVRDGKNEVGKVTADSRGEWVVVPKEPLMTGSRELTLSARSGDGPPAQSERNVVIVVPERTKNGAGAGGGSPSGPLAVLVPREGNGGSIVLQRPGDRTASRGASAARDALTEKRAAGAPVQLSIDAVDYDEAGNVTISGAADPKARLHVYIGNEFAGAGAADQSGRWRLVPGGKLAAGLHTLRVDQVDAGGKVIGRVATQFARSQPANAMADNAVVFVEPGNSLWRIARRVYGKGIQYSVIYEANREQIRDPDLIYPGQVFFVPHVN
jgi:hypothetical protein